MAASEYEFLAEIYGYGYSLADLRRMYYENPPATGGDGGGPITINGETNTVFTIDKAAVGLGNVSNLSPSAYPVSTDQATAIAGRAPANHGHTLAQLPEVQSALDAKQPSGSYAPATHSHSISQIGASTFAQTILDDTSASAVRTTIGAGTSSLALGTTNTTAKAGDYKPPMADLPASVGFIVLVATDGTVTRPTSRTDINGIAILLGTTRPAIVTSPATNGVYENDLVVVSA